MSNRMRYIKISLVKNFKNLNGSEEQEDIKNEKNKIRDKR